MKYSFSFTYAACQSCKQRVNCDRCGDTLREKLLAVPKISETEFQMGKKNLTVETSLEEDALCDTLEDLGVFL